MAKNLTVKIAAEDVTSVGISKYSDGYNYASISAKPGSKKSEASCGCPSESSGCGCGGDYISVSYEWQGNDVPDIVMDIMAFVQSEKAAIDISIEEKAEAWAEYSAKKKGKNPFAKDDDEEIDDKDKKKKDKKDKKGKK